MRLSMITAAALFTCFSMAAHAEGEPRKLVVTGEGSVSVVPDMAVLSLGVSEEARDASEAMQAASASLAEVLESLKAAGVASRDVQTTSINLTPRWDHRQPGEAPRVIGYIASNMLEVKLRDLAAMGATLDEVIGKGANQMHGLRFVLADPDPVEDQARVAAVQEARARAALLADAADVKLGPVLHLSEGHAGMPGPVVPMAREMAMASDVPMAAGELDIRAAVTLVYEILP